MTRLHVAFVLPAGLLGCLTMSAALVVGHAEISQLKPHERRMSPVVETAESPFRVIAGVHVPDPASSRSSVPSPSAATAPDAVLPAPLPAPAPTAPAEVFLPPAEIPADVAETGALRRRVEQVAAAAPEPLEGPVLGVVDTAVGAAGTVLHALGVPAVLGEVREVTGPVVQEVTQVVDPARAAAAETAAQAIDTARG